MDNRGQLTVFHYHGRVQNTVGAFEFATKLALTAANLTNLPAGAQFQLAISAADDKVYVTDPIARHLITVDLQSSTVVNRTQLNFIPHKITWVGIPEPSSDLIKENLLNTMCGDVVGNMMLSPGSGLSVDTATCQTTIGALLKGFILFVTKSI